MSLTESEKNIYNSFLIASRSVKNKPFKLRQDFTTVDDATYVALKKLDLFFAKNNNIKQVEYFSAPYKYYGCDNYFDLQYFLTSKAIKCYSLYQKKKLTQDPDSDDTIANCKECCSFIYRFCRDNNLTLQEYKKLINGTTPIIIQHLRDHKINFYIIQGLQCDSVIKAVEVDLLNFFVSNFYDILNETRINFQRSIKLKNIIREALLIVEKQLLKNKIQTIQ